MSKYCPKCGNQLNDEVNFCGKCGSNVVNVNSSDRINQEEAPNVNMYSQSAPKPKKKIGCLPLIIGFIVVSVIIGAIASISSNEGGSVSTNSSAQNSNGSSTNASKSNNDKPTTANLIFEATGTFEGTSQEIANILESSGVTKVRSLKVDSSLNGGDGEGTIGYVINSVGGDGAILYMKSDKTLSSVQWKDEDLYRNGTQVATIEKIKNRPALEVISYSTESDGYFQYVVGEIRNNSNKNYSYVQVEINLLNGDAVVGSTLDNLNNLAPGQIWKFKAPVFENNVTSFQIVDVTGF